MATLLPSSSAFSTFVVLLLVYAASAIEHLPYEHDDLSSDVKLQELFERWLHHHGKNYTATSQKQSRLEIFKQNLIYIHHHNKGPHSHKLGLNRFADLTLEEFRRIHLGLRPNSVVPPSNLLRQRRSACQSVPPDSVDWRQHGAVTPVKNQGQCGSCWAFSSVGAIEGAHAIATGKLVSLSEQELVSCVSTDGCDGGLMDPAFEWVIKNGGLNTEHGYPYVSSGGRTSTCSLSKRLKKVVSINSYVDVTSGDENSLLCAVAQQPVSVAISAGGYDFQLYTGGVFYGSCSSDPNDVDHAVLVVGYGSENGKDYWIVKNSWGEEWGHDGYVHIQRNIGKANGVCGIHTMPSYPVAKGHAFSSVSNT